MNFLSFLFVILSRVVKRMLEVLASVEVLVSCLLGLLVLHCLQGTMHSYDLQLF